MKNLSTKLLATILFLVLLFPSAAFMEESIDSQETLDTFTEECVSEVVDDAVAEVEDFELADEIDSALPGLQNNSPLDEYTSIGNEHYEDVAVSDSTAYNIVSKAYNAAANQTNDNSPTLIPVLQKTVKSSAALGKVYQIDLGGKTGMKFKSSKKKVATVDANGIITPKKTGKTKITFKVDKKKRTLNLTVVDPTIPNAVHLNKTGTVTVPMGETITLTATIPEGTVSAIKWKSSNKKIATVANGVVTLKKKGKVTITATAARGKKKAKVKFNVTKAIPTTMNVTVYASCNDLNHVGNEWNQFFYVNKKQIGINDSVSFAPGDTIKVRAFIEELDQHPDKKNKTKKYKVKKSDIQNGFSINMALTIKESNGRYAGNKATWNVTFTFGPKV